MPAQFSQSARHFINSSFKCLDCKCELDIKELLRELLLSCLCVGHISCYISLNYPVKESSLHVVPLKHHKNIQKYNGMSLVSIYDI